MNSPPPSPRQKINIGAYIAIFYLTKEHIFYYKKSYSAQKAGLANLKKPVLLLLSISYLNERLVVSF